MPSSPGPAVPLQKLFDSVRYIIASSLPVQHVAQLRHVLDINGAVYLEKGLPDPTLNTVITNSNSFEGWEVVAERKEIRVVSDTWVERSVILGKLQSPQYFSPDPAMIFSGIVACASDLPAAALEVLSAGITGLGGQWRTGLTRDVTHLFVLTPDGAKYGTAMHFMEETGIRIVLPHWFDDTIRLGMGNLPTKPYEWPEPGLLKGADGLLSERENVKARGRAAHAELEQNDVRRNMTPTMGRSSPPAESDISLVLSKALGAKNMSPGLNLKSVQVWNGRKFLLSRTLELYKAHREAVQAGIERAGGVVLRFEGDGDEPEPLTDQQRQAGEKLGKKERIRRRNEAQRVPECDVLVTRWRHGRAYARACQGGKTLGTVAWLFHVQSSGVLSNPQDQLLHYPVPKCSIEAFSKHVIAVTNYTGEAREYIKKLIAAMGATYTPSMSGENTVLIAAYLGGTKADKAQTCSIPVVNHTWLEDCFVQWRCLTMALVKYIVFPHGVDFSSLLGERGVGIGNQVANEVEELATIVFEEDEDYVSDDGQDDAALDGVAIDNHYPDMPNGTEGSAKEVAGGLVDGDGAGVVFYVSKSRSKHHDEPANEKKSAKVSASAKTGSWRLSRKTRQEGQVEIVEDKAISVRKKTKGRTVTEEEVNDEQLVVDSKKVRFKGGKQVEEVVELGSEDELPKKKAKGKPRRRNIVASDEEENGTVANEKRLQSKSKLTSGSKAAKTRFTGAEPEKTSSKVKVTATAAESLASESDDDEALPWKHWEGTTVSSHISPKSKVSVKEDDYETADESEASTEEKPKSGHGRKLIVEVVMTTPPKRKGNAIQRSDDDADQMSMSKNGKSTSISEAPGANKTSGPRSEGLLRKAKGDARTRIKRKSIPEDGSGSVESEEEAEDSAIQPKSAKRVQNKRKEEASREKEEQQSSKSTLNTQPPTSTKPKAPVRSKPLWVYSSEEVESASEEHEKRRKSNPTSDLRKPYKVEHGAAVEPMEVDDDHDSRSSLASPSVPSVAVPRRNAAAKASQRLHDTLMPDLVNFEAEMKKSKKKSHQRAGSLKAFVLEFEEEECERDGGKPKKMVQMEEGNDGSDDEVQPKKKRRLSNGSEGSVRVKEVPKGKQKARGNSESLEVEGSRPSSGVVLLTTQVTLSNDVLKMLAKLGVRITSSPSECTHLLCPHLVRTEKFLCALARAPFILSAKWATDSAAAKKLLPEKGFVLIDPAGEQKFDVNLAQALRRAKSNRGRLLGGKMFYLTPQVNVDKKLLKNVVNSCGGDITTQQPSLRIIRAAPENRYVISCREDISIWRPIAVEGYRIYSQELLLVGIMKQQIEWDREDFMVEA